MATPLLSNPDIYYYKDVTATLLNTVFKGRSPEILVEYKPTYNYRGVALTSKTGTKTISTPFSYK